MSQKSWDRFSRREMLQTSALALGGARLAGEPLEAYPKGVTPTPALQR
jgi:putative sterol carrier protein